MFIACVYKHVEAVRELIKIGVDVNAKCENGNTCLHRVMLCKDGDPRNEQIINILLNGQKNMKELETHQQYQEIIGTDYGSIVNRNTANLNALNDMNKTPIYYASPVRKRAFGWNTLIGNVLNFE